MSDQDRDFEKHMKDTFGIVPAELRVLMRIADGLEPVLKEAFKGSPLENDIDGLLLFTHLSFEEQFKLARYIEDGLLPELALALMVSGDLPGMLEG